MPRLPTNTVLYYHNFIVPDGTISVVCDDSKDASAYVHSLLQEAGYPHDQCVECSVVMTRHKVDILLVEGETMSKTRRIAPFNQQHRRATDD